MLKPNIASIPLARQLSNIRKTISSGNLHYHAASQNLIKYYDDTNAERRRTDS